MNTAGIAKPSLSAVPEPFDYNPSRWKQRIRVSVVAAAGGAIAIYMGMYQLRIVADVWDPVFGAQTKQVLDSDVSHSITAWLRVPDALLGALAYLGDIIFAMAGSTRRWQYRPWIVVIFGLDVIPLGIVSAILVFMQGAVVGAWCFLCLITAVISLVLVFMAYDEVWSCLIYLYRVKKNSDWKTAWWTLWGYPSQVAHEVGMAMARRM